MGYWTDARVDELRSRWNNGESCSQICFAMGAPSRNAIIGKIHRLGLSDPPAKKSKPKQKRRRTNRVVIKMRKTYEIAAPDEPIEFGKPKRFVDLDSDDCHWPGAGSGADMQCCAAPVVAGLSYCARHCRMAYTSAPPVRPVR